MNDALPARTIWRTRHAVAKAVAYLCRKQSYNGGFCFYKFRYLDQPNLRDTYHAVAGLKLSGAEIPRADTIVEYLNRAEVDDVSGLFYYAFALDHLGRTSHIRPSHLARILALPLKRPKFPGNVPIDSWLERTVQTLQLKNHFAALAADGNIVAAIDTIKRQGGYGDKPNLRDTCLSLSALSLLGEELSAREDTRAYVDGLQKPSLGFTDTANSLNTNLDIIAAGMQCCALLKIPVRYGEDILSFVMACETADGSFSRVPVALPDIALTHQALRIIGWLDADCFSDVRHQSLPKRV